MVQHHPVIQPDVAEGIGGAPEVRQFVVEEGGHPRAADPDPVLGRIEQHRLAASRTVAVGDARQQGEHVRLHAAHIGAVAIGVNRVDVPVVLVGPEDGIDPVPHPVRFRPHAGRAGAITSRFGEIGCGIERDHHQAVLVRNDALVRLVDRGPVEQVPGGDIEDAIGGDMVEEGAKGSLHGWPEVSGERGIACAEPVRTGRHRPEKGPVRDNVDPAGGDLRGHVRCLSRRSRHQPHAPLGEGFRPKHDRGEAGAVVGIAHPVGLLEGRAVNVGVLHAGQDRTAAHFPDLVQPGVAATERPDLADREVALDHGDVVQSGLAVGIEAAERHLQETHAAPDRRGVLLPPFARDVTERVVETPGVLAMTAAQILEAIDIDRDTGWGVDLEGDEAGEFAPEVENEIGVAAWLDRDDGGVAGDDRLQCGWNGLLHPFARLGQQREDIRPADMGRLDRPQVFREGIEVFPAGDRPGGSGDLVRDWRHDREHARTGIVCGEVREGDVGGACIVAEWRDERERAGYCRIDCDLEAVAMIFPGNLDHQPVISRRKLFGQRALGARAEHQVVPVVGVTVDRDAIEPAPRHRDGDLVFLDHPDHGDDVSGIGDVIGVPRRRWVHVVAQVDRFGMGEGPDVGQAFDVGWPDTGFLKVRDVACNEVRPRSAARFRDPGCGRPGAVVEPGFGPVWRERARVQLLDEPELAGNPVRARIVPRWVEHSPGCVGDDEVAALDLDLGEETGLVAGIHERRNAVVDDEDRDRVRASLQVRADLPIVHHPTVGEPADRPLPDPDAVDPGGVAGVGGDPEGRGCRCGSEGHLTPEEPPGVSRA